MASEQEPNKAPYELQRFCMCKKELKKSPTKCKKCAWNYCSQACRQDFKREHKLTCGPNQYLNSWWSANRVYLSVLGMWYKVHPDHNYVGMRIDIGDTLEAECKVTPINAQSLDILLQSVSGQPLMYRKGYPDVLCILVAWEGKLVAMEVDLVHDGDIMLGNHQEFETHAAKFITTPAEAVRYCLRP